MKVYKLTDANGMTRGGTQWGEGVTHHATGTGGLCTDGLIHAYEHPLLAVLMSPIHGQAARYTRLWEAEGHGEIVRDGQMMCGFRSLTTIREVDLPVVTTEQRVRFAILCAKRVCSDAGWNAWADRWLSGEDRSAEAAKQAAKQAAKAAWVAAWVAAWAAWAAEAAWATAGWAAEAAAEAAAAKATINLIELAQEACK